MTFRQSTRKQRASWLPDTEARGAAERIIERAAEPGMWCSTRSAAAEPPSQRPKAQTRWIGIDLTYLAISLIKSRLTAMGSSDYTVLGEPTTADDAADLAAEDPYQFQWWALGLIGARPAEGKKGADKGIDGRLFFFDGDHEAEAGHRQRQGRAGSRSSHVRDLRGVLDREQAQIGVLISFQRADPTDAHGGRERRFLHESLGPASEDSAPHRRRATGGQADRHASRRRAHDAGRAAAHARTDGPPGPTLARRIVAPPTARFVNTNKPGCVDRADCCDHEPQHPPAAGGWSARPALPPREGLRS